MKTQNQNYSLIFLLKGLIIVSLCCGETNSQKQNADNKNTAIEKDTCDNPDADINCCFREMPDVLTNILNIAGEDEPGERMIIKGTIFKEDGATPFPDVIIYAYHTDNSGIYSKKGNEKGIRKWHGHLYGWAKTDKDGNYEIHSIKPSRYPGNSAPAHIHSAIKEPGKDEPYYINDFVFKNDSMVNEEYLSSLRLSGDNGVVDIKKNQNDVWEGERDMVLGK